MIWLKMNGCHGYMLLLLHIMSFCFPCLKCGAMFVVVFVAAVLLTAVFVAFLPIINYVNLPDPPRLYRFPYVIRGMIFFGDCLTGYLLNVDLKFLCREVHAEYEFSVLIFNML